MAKGSIRFDNDINVEVAVDPSQAAGAKLLSAVNLVDGQSLGGGGGGGDFALAEVVITNNTGTSLAPITAPFFDNDITTGSILPLGVSPFTFNVIYPLNSYADMFIDQIDDDTMDFIVSENITYNGSGSCSIYGNGTITIDMK